MTILIGIGEEVFEATPEMIAELEATRKTYQEAENKRQSEQKLAEKAKSELLARLGITAEEAKLLLG